MFINKTLLFIVTYPWLLYPVFSLYLRNVNSKRIRTQQRNTKITYSKEECDEIFNEYQCTYIAKSMQNYMKKIELKFRRNIELFENNYHNLHHGLNKYATTRYTRNTKFHLLDDNIKKRKIDKTYKHPDVYRTRVR